MQIITLKNPSIINHPTKTILHFIIAQFLEITLTMATNPQLTIIITSTNKITMVIR